MLVSLLHNSVDAGDGPDRRDVLDQVEAVGAALRRLGHRPAALACDLDLARLRRELARTSPDAVFNLVESLDGQDRLIALVPSLVEALGLPLTGVPSLGLAASTGKLASKRALERAGIPVPPCLGCWPRDPAFPADPDGFAGRVIVKSVWEHGSPGIDDATVLDSSRGLAAALERLAPRFGGSCFAEPYVEGREFNLSLLASPDGPEVLPPAEIRFVDFPQGKPRIVGFPAKWMPESFEYRNTPRSFDFADADGPLLARLEELAVASWEALDLAGYARVDFRVDGDGRPFVLEVNANPCLTPDAGFAAALERAGIPFDAAVERLLDDALQRAGGPRVEAAVSATR
jgi:D-alanine-D-alanine ligase